MSPDPIANIHAEILASRSRPTPEPMLGDGICATQEQYQSTMHQAKCSWEALISRARNESSTPAIGDSLFELLEHVPRFPSSETNFRLIAGCFLQIECSSEWITSTDPDCSLPRKSSKHYQILAIPKPVVCSSSGRASTSLTPGNRFVFSELVVAWSHVLCSYWVESLQASGYSAQLLYEQQQTVNNDRRQIIGKRWHACISLNRKKYFAPWSLMGSTTDLTLQTECVQSDSSSTIDMLSTYCKTNDCFGESMVALAVVMMVPSRALSAEDLDIPFEALPFKFSSSDSMVMQCQNLTKLSNRLGQIITLSCSPESIDSLLCSSFFNPDVSCNLIGAQMDGIQQSKLSILDRELLLKTMYLKSPRLLLLWAASIVMDRFDGIFHKVVGGTPPANLHTLCWTQTLGSFLQVSYLSAEHGTTRATEFLNTYLLNECAPPCVPSPPFGDVPLRGLDIDVCSHLKHTHGLLSYGMRWEVGTGDDKTLTEHFTLEQHTVVSEGNIFSVGGCSPYCISSSTPRIIPKMGDDSAVDNAEKGSFNATLNLFAWLLNIHEGGSWVDPFVNTIAEGNRGWARHLWIAPDTDDGDDIEAGVISGNASVGLTSDISSYVEGWLADCC